MNTQGFLHTRLASSPHPAATLPRLRSIVPQAAFTLAEVLVAVFLGSMMLTALYAAFTFGYSTVKVEREDLRATQILVEQMEGLRLTPFTSLQAVTTNAYFDPLNQTNGTAGALYTITITTNAPTAAELTPPGMVNPVVYYAKDMRKITATATWTNSNLVRTRTLQTYASKNGIQGYVNKPQ